MSFHDWTAPLPGRLGYSDGRFALAKAFVFDKWCTRALEQQRRAPDDLSGTCKHGSIFMQQVFGGGIRGHFQHQYNLIDGRIVDLSHDAGDVTRMGRPYLHEPDYFAIPEVQQSLAGCLPRASSWAAEFLDTHG